MKIERILWLDRLRGFALFFVVLGHVALSADKISIIYSFHMPLFFIISGMTINNQKILAFPFKSQITDKAKKLLLPYLWMSFFSYPLWYITFHKISSTKTTIFQAFKGIFFGNNVIYYSSPSNALWFLLVLFFAYILYTFIIKMAKGDEAKMMLSFVVCAILGYLEHGISQIWHFNVAFTAVSFLYLGRCFMNLYHNHSEWFENSTNRNKWVLIFALFVIGYFCHIWNGRISMTANKFGNSLLLFYLTAIAFSASIALIVIMLPKLRLVEYIGQNSLLYVGIHLPIIRLFEKLFPSTFEKELNCVWLAFAVYFGVAIICAIFNYLFPYVCAKRPVANQKLHYVGKVILGCVCIVIPMIAIFEKMGCDIDSKPYSYLLLITTLLLSLAFTTFSSRFYPVIYCEETNTVKR